MKKIIKIGTFNLFNLVLPNINYYGNRVYSLSDYNKKTDWIAQQLVKMDAQIVGFQEIFHTEALKDAIRKSELYEHGTIVTTPEKGDRPIVGLVSNFPVIGFHVYDNFPEKSMIKLKQDNEDFSFDLPFTKFSRPVLRVDINIYGVDYMVYSVHLKSKRPMFLDNERRENPIDVAKAQTRSLILRAAEATALRSILLNDLKDKKVPVILFGDLNDTGLSVTTKIISGEAPHRRYPQDVKKRIWDTLLYHVKDIQSRHSYGDFYYTHIHNGHYESLDQIMVSEELVAENPERLGRVGYVSLFNDHLLDQTLTDERIAPWQSDHGQVVASIELKKKNKEHVS